MIYIYYTIRLISWSEIIWTVIDFVHIANLLVPVHHKSFAGITGFTCSESICYYLRKVKENELLIYDYDADKTVNKIK